MAPANPSISSGSISRPRLNQGSKTWLAILALLIIGTFAVPATPFIIDGGIYHDMAKAMATDGTLHIGSYGNVESAPALTKYLTIAHDDHVYPQYPSGYAFLAAPFYKLFGVQGLILMNALAFAASLFLTRAIAIRLFGSAQTKLVAPIFALATIAPTYVFGIWPHMFALAVWLGAIYAAVKTVDTDTPRQAWCFIGVAGLLIGLGINIRVDIFLAVLVIFFWLRIFARPRDRIAPLFLLLGVLPGLLFSAILNEQKFGMFTPFSYGNTSDGLDSLSQYAPFLFAAAGAIGLAWIFDISALFRRIRSNLSVRTMALAALIAAIAILLSPIGGKIINMIAGVYVLVFNLQAHDAYRQVGVEYNAYGHLLYWGYPKKALIQSLPWMPLIILPVIAFFKGNHVRSVAFCLLAIAAPICFYSLNHWHGGGSYNMRYFLPAVPFLAILASVGLATLMRGDGFSRQSLLIALLAAGVLCLLLQEIGQSIEALYAPGALYPQWIIAALLAGAVCAFALRNTNQLRKATLHIALFAITYGIAINLYEEFVHERTRAEQLARASDISAPIPKDALVITASPLSFMQAESNGAYVMAADEKTLAQAGKAARAFLDAGRCVYFHNSYARDLVASSFNMPIEPKPIWAQSIKFTEDPRLAFFMPAGSDESCRF